MKKLADPGGQPGPSRVFTVPAGRPFLAVLARAILHGQIFPRSSPPPPLSLPGITLLVPSYQAARALEDAFLLESAGALLLPRIRAISAPGDGLSLLAGPAADSLRGDLEIPPAVLELERRLALTRLVLAWADAAGRNGSTVAPVRGVVADTPAKAVRLAGDLCRLMDLMETENVSFARLAALVPAAFREHWRRTLSFLEIVTNRWPAYLAERGAISAVERRKRLLRAEALRLAADPFSGPYIVAGPTAASPDVLELIRAVLRRPDGVLVLPGLDVALDEASWRAITPVHLEHPQFALKRLIDDLGFGRQDVGVLGSEETPARGAARLGFIAEVMRPAATTARWQNYAETADRGQIRFALDGLTLVEAPSAADEAEAVALILREAMERPDGTAALVTPDRHLARRVVARLAAWGIEVAESAGQPLARCAPGAFLDLVVTAAAKDFAPVDLMALLHHPLARLGLHVNELRSAAATLEIAAFRAPFLGGGLDGVRAALDRAEREVASGERRHRAVRGLAAADWKRAADLVERLAQAFAPLREVFGSRTTIALSELAAAHAAAAGALSRVPPNEGVASPLWNGDAGEAVAALFAGLTAPGGPSLMIPAAGYPDFYRTLVGLERVAGAVSHPRLRIWSPADARLHHADLVVLGSLNEGAWPENADPGPWLGRPMLQAIGLPAPEERVGESAHDVATLLAADRVILTRAEKVDGTPTVRSRWLMRLLALLDALKLRDVIEPETPWLAWARSRDSVTCRKRLGAPEPRPVIGLRPRRLSVSAIETWIGNPYAIFAREILKLEPLDPLGAEPGPSVRGAVIHEALARFAQKFPDALPADMEAELLQIARLVLTEYAGHPRVAAFWLPRFERFAAWFAETEPDRRTGVSRVVAETTGERVLRAPAGPFTLRARADRIDVCEGGLIITDFKTGAMPADARVLAGTAPQLPLEAAIAAGAGFAHVPEGRVTALRYIRASGGEPPGLERIVKCAGVSALADEALDGLARLVARFDREETPYRAVRRAGFAYDWDSYAHLARAAEWSGAEET